MGRISRGMWLSAILIILPLGCGQHWNPNTAPAGVPVVRVRLLQDQQQITVVANANPTVSTTSDPTPRAVAFPVGMPVPVTLGPTGWHVGAISFGTGELSVRPSMIGSVTVNNQPYRGNYRFVPVSNGHFDVINDVDVDSYLLGVLSREMFHNWHAEAYRAQAIVARTYVLYEANTAGVGRYWDVYPDQRSQMYGGIAAESDKSRDAVQYTAGVVLTYGQPGQEKIFKAYFSSCCGGVTQAAADAFPGDPLIPPLTEQDVGALRNASPHFNWGPVAIRKDELTRRVKIWADRKARQDGRPRPESSIALIARVDTASVNRFGRPSRFVVTDVRGVQYSMSSEEFRSAANADSGQGPTLLSSFFKIDNPPGGDAIRFVDGHGFGHGVGMCQWCAEARAADGMSHEQILAAAFPQSKLARAY